MKHRRMKDLAAWIPDPGFIADTIGFDSFGGNKRMDHERKGVRK